MCNKTKKFWKLYKDFPFDMLGYALVNVTSLLSGFGKHNNLLTIVRIIVALIMGICFCIAIKQDLELELEDKTFPIRHYGIFLFCAFVAIVCNVYLLYFQMKRK